MGTNEITGLNIFHLMMLFKTQSQEGLCNGGDLRHSESQGFLDYSKIITLFPSSSLKGAIKHIQIHKIKITCKHL